MPEQIESLRKLLSDEEVLLRKLAAYTFALKCNIAKRRTLLNTIENRRIRAESAAN